MFSLIEASPHSGGAAYAAVDRHKLDDFRPYIYKTSDYGKSWTAIGDGIPAGAYVHAVREDPKRKGLLYAGTETGVWISFDDGAHWEPLQLNLPTVPVHDLAIKNDDLVVATHGRSFWILDDVGPLRQWSAATAASETVLFPPRPAFRVRFPDEVNKRQPVGENPPAGAILYYYLKTAPSGEIKLEILDAQEQPVKTYTSLKKAEEGPAEWPDVQKLDETLPTERGLNRFAWNLRYEDPVKIPGAFYESDTAPKGAMALPGVYRAKLTVGGASQTVSVEVKPDPRAAASADDLEKQFDLKQKISRRLTVLHKTVTQLRDLRAQVQALHRKYTGAAVWEPLQAGVAELIAKLTAIEEQLVQTKVRSTEGDLNFPTMVDEQMTYLSFAVDAGDAAPTVAQGETFELLSRRIEEQLSKWDRILSQDLANLNRLAEKQKLPLIDAR